MVKILLAVIVIMFVWDVVSDLLDRSWSRGFDRAMALAPERARRG